MPVPAQCGISRIWVLQQYRRKKIATRILDCVRCGACSYGSVNDGGGGDMGIVGGVCGDECYIGMMRVLMVMRILE